MCMHTVLKSKGEYKFAKGGYVINVANETVCMRVIVPLLALHMHSFEFTVFDCRCSSRPCTVPCQLGGAIGVAIVVTTTFSDI